MKIGVIADDFTGASDIALTLAEAGMRTLQFVGVPSQQIKNCDAGVVSLKIRTSPLQQALAQSLEACDWLLSQGAEQIIYKVCSTFDSTSEGNIGQVTEALAERLNEHGVLVCPAFPENGRSVYQGHLFVGDRLLNESGMENHPLTPMKDADLRRLLGLQTRWPVGHIASNLVSRGAGAIATQIEPVNKMYIVDAITDADLRMIGTAAAGRKLLCGGSGLAIGLPANFGFSPAVPPWSGVEGQGVILAGSCSNATRLQIQKYRMTSPALELGARSVMEGKFTSGSLADWVFDQKHSAPLVYSSSDPATVIAAQNEFGKQVIAERIEGLFQALATELVRRGISRIVAAGGETSGAIVAGLGARVLEVGRKIAPGVPALRVDDRPFAIALKSGNFGDEDFFAKADAVLRGAG